MNVTAMDHHALPASLETEQAVLGAVLLNPDAVALCKGLEADHFAEPAHAAIWQRVTDFGDRGERVSYSLLAGTFRDEPLMPGGPTAREYMARLAAEATTVSGIGLHAAMIRSMWALRSLIGVGGHVAQGWGGSVPETLLSAAFERVEEIRAALNDHSDARPRKVDEIGAGILASAQERQNGGGFRPPSSGLVDLDAKLPLRGLAPGSLLVLAGRTGMGKSMLLSSIARQAARRCGVAFFSLEVGSEEMAARMLSDTMGNGPSYEELLSGELTDQQMERAFEANHDLQSLACKIDASGSITIGEIERKSAAYANALAKADQKLGLVVIDHAQIVKPTGRYAGNRVGELGEIANAAKVMAKRLGCCVALASQVNRSVESKEDKRPTMSDLRASGEIEEAADVIGLLYRPAYYVERSPEFKAGDPTAQDEFDAVKNVLELAIDKSRQGRTGVVNLWCDPARSMVRSRSSFDRIPERF